MEKVLRALAETENNAAAIRALQKQINESYLRKELDAQAKKIAEAENTVATVSKKVTTVTSKVNTVSSDVEQLKTAVEEFADTAENVAAIGETVGELQSSVDELTKNIATKPNCISVKGVYSSDKTYMTFGAIKANSPALLIVRFDGESERAALYSGSTRVVAAMMNPLVAPLPVGTWRFSLKPGFTNAYIIAFGDVSTA